MTNSNGHGQIEGRRLCLTNLILCNGNIMEAKKIKYTYHGYSESFLVISRGIMPVLPHFLLPLPHPLFQSTLAENAGPDGRRPVERPPRHIV